MSELIQQPVYISKEHKKFLKQKAINLSQYVRNKLDEEMKKGD